MWNCNGSASPALPGAPGPLHCDPVGGRRRDRRGVLSPRTRCLPPRECTSGAHRGRPRDERHARNHRHPSLMLPSATRGGRHPGPAWSCAWQENPHPWAGLEFWPDYGGALLWSEAGERRELDSLSLTEALVVVREEEPEQRARQHCLVYGRDLVRKWLDEARADRHEGVDKVCAVDALRLGRELEGPAVGRATVGNRWLPAVASKTRRRSPGPRRWLAGGRIMVPQLLRPGRADSPGACPWRSTAWSSGACRAQ